MNEAGRLSEFTGGGDPLATMSFYAGGGVAAISVPMIRKSRKSRGLMRSYDAAATSRHNQNHWLYATGGDADAVIAPDLATLRNRARYEIENNSFAKGIVEGFGDDIVRIGPTLEYIEEIEQKFSLWMEHCDMGGKLHFAEGLKQDVSQWLGSGESLTNLGGSLRGLDMRHVTRIDGVGVKMPGLQLLRFEADRLATPMKFTGDPNVREGIRVDDFGRPLEYYILKRHPGSRRISGAGIDEHQTIAAQNIIHSFKQTRPEQTRGVPWLVPALPLFALLRRYTLAVITAAETGADISAVIEAGAANVEPADLAELESWDVERNSMFTLPKGWTMKQFMATQPMEVYQAFKREIVNEICRPINMPLNVGLGNSSGYNYASGRLDWQGYDGTIKIGRKGTERHTCNPVLSVWLREALSMPGYLTKQAITEIRKNEKQPEWLWTEREHVDPEKTAKARKINLETGQTTLTNEWIISGKDPEKQRKILEKELKWFKDNHMKHPFGGQKSVSSVGAGNGEGQ